MWAWMGRDRKGAWGWTSESVCMGCAVHAWRREVSGRTGRVDARGSKSSQAGRKRTKCNDSKMTAKHGREERERERGGGVEAGKRAGTM